MIAIAVDDEQMMLNALTAAVKASPDISEVKSFSTCSAALAWAEKRPVELAFLDIHMRGMGGLALAERLQQLCPQCKIIFCTGYEEYAVEAFRLHVSGYLMKPISPQAVQREIDHIKGRTKAERLQVRCFGYFEASFQGKPLHFKRSKTKELLAFLVECNGSGVTTKQICSKLWAEDSDDVKNANYLYQLFDDLRSTLRALQLEDILIRSGFSYAIDPKKLDCDYYDFLQTGKPSFMGEYMTQYSWAEETCGRLLKK
ncbi:MAG: response regulator [Anaerotignum sp.]